MKKKKGELNLSFGMIFSIILIIIFIIFAFYGIKTFLNLKDDVQSKKFITDLQNDVNKLWAGSQGSREVEYLLSNKVTEICFINDEFQNLVLNSEESFERGNIANIDIIKTLNEESSLCIPNLKGKVTFTIEKNFGEKLVTIKK